MSDLSIDGLPHRQLITRLASDDQVNAVVLQEIQFLGRTLFAVIASQSPYIRSRAD